MNKYYLHLRRSKPDFTGWTDNQTFKYTTSCTEHNEVARQFRFDHPEHNDKHIASIFNKKTKAFLYR